MKIPTTRFSILKPARKVAAAGRYVWRMADIRKPESWLSTLVNLLLRIGTLLLMVAVVLLVWRIFKDDGYSIEAIAMPETLQKDGFSGVVVAGMLQDAYLQVKSEASSIKADSVSTSGGEEQVELHVAVMGFGVSLRSIAFQLRELIGRRSNLVRGAITMADSSLAMTLRMTGYKPVVLEESLRDGERTAIQRLMRRAGEQILDNTDPYRLAIYLNRKKRFDESVKVLRRMIVERPTERQWAFLAWGDNYEDQGRTDEAMEKFQASIDSKPDFALPWMRMAWALDRKNRPEEALKHYKQAVLLKPDEPSYWSSYGRALARAQQHDASDEAYGKMAALTVGQSGWLINWAEGKANRGDIEGARKILQQAVQGAQTDIERSLSDAFLALIEQDTARCYRSLMQVMELDPNQPFAVGFAINTNFKLKKYAEVIRLGTQFEPQIGNDELHQNVLNYTAMAYNATGQHQLALTTAQRAVEIIPTISYPYTTLAETYAFMGQTEAFYSTLETAIQKGFSVRNVPVEEEPYRRFVQSKRFKDLLQRYFVND